MCYLKHNPCMASPNQDWKHQRGGIGKMTPKYVEAHTDDAPDEASGPPDLVICKTEGGKLVTKNEFEGKYSSMHSFPISDTLAAIVTEGPKLFLSAVGVADVGVQDPILTFGAGTWLLDAQATSYMEDRSVGVYRWDQWVLFNPPCNTYRYRKSNSEYVSSVYIKV